MNSAKIIIIGAGIVGRIAKLKFNDALIFEKSDGSITTMDSTIQILQIPIPNIAYKKIRYQIFIDNEYPTVEKINQWKIKMGRYKDINEVTFGDLIQFNPNGYAYYYTSPNIANYSGVYFSTRVTKILLFDKKIETTIGEFSYDFLINTIPLPNFLNMIDGFDFSKLKFVNKVLFVKRECIKSIEKDVLKNYYFTSLDNPINRILELNDLRVIESFSRLENSIELYPGKVFPNKNTEDILDWLKVYDIYCIGRYAEWNPKIQVHDSYLYLNNLDLSLKNRNFIL